MHLCMWGGNMMGVDPDFLVDDEAQRHRMSYHVLRAQGPLTAAGPKLAQAVIEAQGERSYPGWPGSLQRLRARYEKERLLSMLTVFLGVRSMRELGLPVRPPWAHAYLIPLNQWRYRILARGERGRRRLDAWGRRRRQWLLDSYFLGETEDVGPLKG
jgi:hypothetical protein